MTTKKVARKKAVVKAPVKVLRVVPKANARKGSPAVSVANVLVVDDYEREIRKFYGVSKKEAVAAAKRAGILTPKGRLSATYK